MNATEYKIVASTPPAFVGSCHANANTQQSICDGQFGLSNVRIVVTGGEGPLFMTRQWPQFLRELADAMER